MQQPSTFKTEPIPGYRLIERLGRGGYGEVWKAEAPGGMHKAIKFVYGDMNGIGDDGKAAEQEFRSLNRVKTIRHPFLLTLERIEVIDGQLVIVMELADRNLWDRFTECIESGLSGIPRPELLSYMEEAAEALDLMNVHYQLQHLDIKPQNIFLVHRHVKVADFGLAKDLEGTRGELTGGITPMYAPPETFEQWVSRQSDQYSLAIVYMEMLTGRRPFNGTSPRQLIMQHMMAAPDLSNLQSPDREAVARALEKKPDNRFKTCTEFVRAIKGEIAAGAPKSSNGAAGFAASAPADTPSLGSRSTQPVTRGRTNSLPALVTPRSKTSASVSNTPRARGLAATPARNSGAPVERVGDGVLFPALIVGIGGIGLLTLRALRQSIADRFGRGTLPHLRWLFIDTDPKEIESAQAGPPELSLSADEVLLTHLQRPAHYLSKEGLPPVDAWLTPVDLYSIPRSSATNGIRALGRLALCDHYHLVCQRVRAALEPFLSESRVEDAKRLTGLGIRSTFPRIYVVSSLSGGTGSGMLVDLTYLIRREAVQLGFGSPQTVGLLGMPGPSDDTSNRRSFANARAALAELKHFGRPDSPYRALFDTRERKVEDAERAFRRSIAFRLPEKSDQATRTLAAFSIANVAFTELLSLLGRTIYPDAAAAPENPLAAVGIQRVVWPRTQVIHAAGWQLAKQTLKSWLSKESPDSSAVLREFVDRQWEERRLDRIALRNTLESQVTSALGAAVRDRIAQALAGLADDSNPDGSQTARVRLAFRQLIELLGKPGPQEHEPPFAVGAPLAARAKELTAQTDVKLLAAIRSLIEQPGLRLAGAEAAVHILCDRIDEKLRVADCEAGEIEDSARTLFQPIHNQLVASGIDAPLRGTYLSTTAEAANLLQHWATAHFKGLIARACANVYRGLLGVIPEYIRELTLTRTQLTAFATQLDGAGPTATYRDGVCVPIFPDGATNVSDAADRLLKTLGPGQLKEFENALQARIRHDLRGLGEICGRPKDLWPGFLALINDQATHFLESRAPKLKAVDLVLDRAKSSSNLETFLTTLITAAAPDALGKMPAVVTVLGLPDESGPIPELVRGICRNDVVRVGISPDDIVVWRESRGLKLSSFAHLDAENASLMATEWQPNPSAHSRTDVQWCD